MIRFHCHCSHEFLVNEDQAGALVQCPKCSRLNDVPALSDLQNLEDDVYKIDEAPKGPSKKVLPDATRAYTRDLQDESGRDIDMRSSVDEFLNIGAEEVPLELAEEERPAAPKYDPLTGELVESIDIKPPDKPTGPDAKKIPVAKRAVSYATPDIAKRVTPMTIFIALLQPVNLVVMAFVLGFHIVFQFCLSLVMPPNGLFFVAPVVIIVGGLLIAHYGCIIEELGSTQNEELPRPLRDGQFLEDIWFPFIRFNFSVLVCFWPVIFQWQISGPVWVAMKITYNDFGVYFFPAVLITTILAGSYLNLRLDRLIGVIRACGAGYWLSVIAFAVGGTIYLGAIGLLKDAASALFATSVLRIPLIGFAIGSPTLLLGIYLFHFACWHLALLYRGNHDRFPWILQRHVASRRTDTLAQLEAARKAAKRLDALRKNKPDRDQRVNEIRTADKAKAAAKDAKPIWDRVAETQND
jgi:hypothetical protein